MDVAITGLVADMKQQQLKAMSGDTEGRATADKYGVHFTSNSYVLFHGSSYSAGDAANYSINLDQNLTFIKINVPSSNIIFSQVSGDVSGFNASQNSVTIKNTGTNQQKVIQFNRYGVITSVN